MSLPNLSDLSPKQAPAKLVSLFLYGSIAVSLLAGCNRLSSPKDLQSVSISLARTDCQAFCPVYSVTIHGNGNIEYQGALGVPVRGHRTAQIPQQKVVALLQEMDKAGFMSFDDKTFSKLSDSGDVIMSVSIDGKNKTVRSSRIEGSDRPLQDLEKFNQAQARFVKLADKIDALVEIDRWTKCSLNCMNLLHAMSFARDRNFCPNLLEVIQSKEPLQYESVFCDAQTMIEAGADVNVPDESGVTPLMAAAKNGDAPLVRDLLAHDAIPGAKDERGRTALDYAKTPEIRTLLIGRS